jgi:hypothetical protein
MRLRAVQRAGHATRRTTVRLKGEICRNNAPAERKPSLRATLTKNVIPGGGKSKRRVHSEVQAGPATVKESAPSEGSSLKQ